MSTMITKPADIPAAQDAKTLFPLPPPRLLPRIVSQTARDDPTKIWGSIPLDRHTAAKGFEDISYRRFSYAVDRAAWWIRKHVEPYRNQEPGPIAYIGVPDARYQILTLGAIKAGFHVRTALYSEVKMWLDKELTSLAEDAIPLPSKQR